MLEVFEGIVKAEFLEFDGAQGRVSVEEKMIRIDTGKESVSVMKDFYRVEQVGGVVKVLERTRSEMQEIVAAKPTKADIARERKALGAGPIKRLILTEEALSYYTAKAKSITIVMSNKLLKDKVEALIDANIPIKVIALVLGTKYQHCRAMAVNYLGAEGYDAYKSLPFNDYNRI